MDHRIVPAIPPTDMLQRSKFELFNAQEGVLRMKEFYTLPSSFLKYAKSEVILIRATDTQTWDMLIALNIKFQGAQKERSAYLDQDEISQLGRTLAYMRENQESIIRMAKTYTELAYTSRAGFSAGFYVHADKTSEGYINIDGECAFLQSLSDFEKVIDEALFKIELFSRGGG